MDLKTQEKISKLMLTQSEKLGKALSTLRKAQKLLILRENDVALIHISASLKEIADYDKHSEDL